MQETNGSHLQHLPITSQQIDGDFHITCHAFSTFLKFTPLNGHIQIISYFTCRRKITVSRKSFSTSTALSGGYRVLKSAYQERLLKMDLDFFLLCAEYIEKWPWTHCLQCISTQYCCLYLCKACPFMHTVYPVQSRQDSKNVSFGIPHFLVNKFQLLRDVRNTTKHF